MPHYESKQSKEQRAGLVVNLCGGVANISVK